MTEFMDMREAKVWDYPAIHDPSDILDLLLKLAQSAHLHYSFWPPTNHKPQTVNYMFEPYLGLDLGYSHRPQADKEMRLGPIQPESFPLY